MSFLSRYKCRFVLVVALVVAVAFLAVGFYSRQTVLKSNPCEMTYSKREKTEIALCGKNCEYKLWKISNPNSKTLNMQPVLFIPGHLGR